MAEPVVHEGGGDEATRRDFIHIAAGAAAIDLVPGRPAPEQPTGPSVRLLSDGQLTYVSLGARWP